MSIFVYRPRSGDRVFAYYPTEEVGIALWGNGSRHVFGGVHLVLCPGGQGSPRLLARRFTEDLVASHGGIAWDEQGIVHVVTARMGAFRAAAIIRQLDAANSMISPRPVDGSGLCDPLPQLYLQDRASLDFSGGFSARVPTLDPFEWTDLQTEEGPAKIVEPPTAERDAIVSRRALITAEFIGGGIGPDLVGAHAVRDTALVPAPWINVGRWLCGPHDVYFRDRAPMPEAPEPPVAWGDDNGSAAVIVVTPSRS